MFALCGWLLVPLFHSWRLCFIVPAAIAAAGGVAVLFLFKDSPEEVGRSVGDASSSKDSSLSSSSRDSSNSIGATADYRSYVDMQDKVEKVYLDKTAWTKMSIMNTARSGKFSSDRTIREYAEDIWNIKPVKVEID